MAQPPMHSIVVPDVHPAMKEWRERCNDNFPKKIMKVDADNAKLWFDALFKEHGVDPAAAHAFVQSTAHRKQGRWDLPLEPTLDSYDRLAQTINDAIAHFGIHNRKAIVTARKAIPLTQRGLGATTSMPDIMLIGHDPSQLPHQLAAFKPTPSIVGKEIKDEETLATILETDLKRCYAYLQGTIATGEVSMANEVNQNQQTEIFNRLAFSTQACFIQQGNRHRKFSFSLRGDKFKLFMFDRSGAVEAEAVDINKDPVTFVQLLAVLTGRKLENVGFDTTIFYEEGQRYIALPNTKADDKNNKFRIQSIHFQRQDIVGRGTVCWDAVNESEHREDWKRVLVKDAWVSCARETEDAFLWEAFGVEGVSQIVASCGFPTTTYAHRTGIRGAAFDDFRSANHFRVVVKKEGTNVINFGTPLAFIKAFKTAIKAHHALVKRGILHRDISINNIIMNADGTDGVLIDFDVAIFLEDLEYMEGHVHRTGTFHFFSRNLLRTLDQTREDQRLFHDFIDDLESFLWVLVWIMTVCNGPGEDRKLNSADFPLLMLFASESPNPAIIKKEFMEDCRSLFTPTSFFCLPLYIELISDLCDILRPLSDRKIPGGPNVRVPYVQYSDEERDDIYRRIIACFDKALGGLAEYGLDDDQWLRDLEAEMNEIDGESEEAKTDPSTEPRDAKLRMVEGPNSATVITGKEGFVTKCSPLAKAGGKLKTASVAAMPGRKRTRSITNGTTLNSQPPLAQVNSPRKFPNLAERTQSGQAVEQRVEHYGPASSMDPVPNIRRSVRIANKTQDTMRGTELEGQSSRSRKTQEVARVKQGVLGFRKRREREQESRFAEEASLPAEDVNRAVKKVRNAAKRKAAATRRL